MKIKGIEFNVNAASGALGWFGEGYWYHKIYGFIFPSFKKTMADLNFVTKTIVLNAVSLSGPGFVPLLASGKLQKIKRGALGISFMPVGRTIEEMLFETRSFRDKLIETINRGHYYFKEIFQSPIWVQVNQSCSNTIRSDGQILAYMKDILGMLQPLRKTQIIVLDLKVNFLIPNEVIADICKSDLCDVITISNTIKFGNEESDIPWKSLFWWRTSSPLAKFGGGGLSGKPLFEAVCNKIICLRNHGIKIPIKVSGGIFSVSNVKLLKACGASAIEFATVISLRPWRISRIVKEARRIF